MALYLSDILLIKTDNPTFQISAKYIAEQDNLSWFLILHVEFFSFSGTIVSIGDPKKKYTRYEKIGQG